MTGSVATIPGGLALNLDHDFEISGTDWSIGIETPTSVTNHVYWQGISEPVKSDSLSFEDNVSSWDSPGGFFGDDVHFKYGRKHSSGSLDGISERRRAQNRASQRAYRERRERHVKGLEEQLEDMACQRDLISKKHAKLHAEHQKLLEDAEQWKSKLVDVKEAVQSRTIDVSSHRAGENELLVKVMICKKDCRNMEFSERL